MFEEDIFKDAKYCVPCNKFYVTSICPFCTPKNKESGVSSQEPGVITQDARLRTQDSQTHKLNSRIEELGLEIERLRRENKGLKTSSPDPLLTKHLELKEKELELKFNILADKFERLSQKEKDESSPPQADLQRDEREQTSLPVRSTQTGQKPPKRDWHDRNDVKIKNLRSDHAHPIVHDNGKNAQTEQLLKERIKELKAELEQLQQRSEKKDQQVLQSVAETSKLSGIAEQQKDELERLRFDIQERDRVIMQISLTLSSAISQALAQRSQEKLQELMTSHPPANPTVKRNKRSRKTLYAVLGGLNAVVIGYLGCAFLYKKDAVSLIIEFFRRLFEK